MVIFYIYIYIKDRYPYNTYTYIIKQKISNGNAYHNPYISHFKSNAVKSSKYMNSTLKS